MRIAIAVLTKGYSSLAAYTDLVLRNKAVASALSSYSCDSLGKIDLHHLVFHEGNISVWQQILLSIACLPLRLRFIDISSYFAQICTNKAQVSSWCCETDLSRMFGDGYKCMCAFWLDGFLSYSKHYDYVVRIDEDCRVVYLPLDDIISAMESDQSLVAAGCVLQEDSPDVTIGLEEFALNHSAQNKSLAPPRFDHNPYTNLAVFNCSALLRNSSYHSFCSEVHGTGCIMINRWGDMPLWGAFLSMLTDQNSLLVHREIKYYHGSHSLGVNLPSSFVPNHFGYPFLWTLVLILCHAFDRYLAKLPRWLTSVVLPILRFPKSSA